MSLSMYAIKIGNVITRKKIIIKISFSKRREYLAAIDNSLFPFPPPPPPPPKNMLYHYYVNNICVVR